MKDKIGYVYLLITVVFFSTLEVVSKSMNGAVGPFQNTFVRFLIGGILLLGICALNKDLKVSVRDLAALLGIGFLNIFISMNLLQLSLFSEGASAATVAVIFSSNPIFVALFSSIIDKEKMDRYKVIGLAVGVVGVVVVFGDKLNGLGSQIISPLLAVLSAAFYGLYTVLGKHMTVRLGAVKMNAYSFLLGSICMLPIFLFVKEPIFKFPIEVMPQMLYLAIFVTGVAYITYFLGIKSVGASKGSMVFFLKPVLASVIAIIILKEKPTLNLAIGTLCVVLGITIVLYGKKIINKRI